MGFMFAPFRKYADFSGRSRRKEYWLFQLLLLTVYMAFTFAFSSQSEDAGFGALAFIAGLALVIPSIAVAVRRMHDIGKSGWWLCVGFIPIIGGIWQLALLLTAGNRGPNRYGPDPKQLTRSDLPMARVV